ncbi:LuxR family transcriptional regulator [Lentzea sp. NBRC 105346]|uniref:LuxR C-terminal-related transcriptional regulator n=1 Tax=Lentzea sp. NBRC 105346 TaxID=3032205 RepID=UPI0024A13E7B|nr:LuxR C-terminal-related transcriptional regulator [Lentzea sp. NBRC 105346]GLZ34238.1 LuxR family transcriptional regulator [Lentzea sp. NBRC 105346]
MTTPLVGRENELSFLRGLLTDAVGGTASCVVIAGGIGAGKTALLDAMTAQAQQLGFKARSARCSRLESHLSGGVVRQLAACLDNELDLEELYERVLGTVQKAPLLIAIDDVHLADTWSKRAVAFIRPRLDRLPVVIALCVAQGHPALDEVSLPEITGADPHRIELGGLDVDAVRQLTDKDPEAAHEATAGNPYLLHQLLREPGDVRTAGSASVGETLRARLRDFDGAAEVVRSAAVLGEDATIALLSALTGFDVLPSVDPLVRMGILADTDPLTFAQPFVRNSILADMPVAVRSAGHARAAWLLYESDAPDERIADHVLKARSVRLPWAVDVLREVGRVEHLERALEEHLSEEDKLAVQVELGHVRHLMDPAEGRDMIRDALARAEDPHLAAHTALNLILRMCSRSDAHLAVSLAILVVGRLMPEDRDLVWHIVCATYLMAAGREPQMAHCAAKYYDDLIGETPRDPALQRSRSALLAIGNSRRGDSATEAVEHALEALDGEWIDVLGEPFVFTFLLPVLTDHPDHTGRFWRALSSAPVSHDPHLRQGVLTMIARGAAFHATGDLARAYTFLTQPASGDPECPAVLLASAKLAEVCIEMGQFDEALPLVAHDGELLQHSHILYARGRLKLASCHPEGALEDLLECGRRLEQLDIHNPALMPWRHHVVRAHLALGNRDEALRVAQEDLDLAKRWGTPKVMGIALIGVGIATEDVKVLAEACDVLDASPHKLLHAQALYWLGLHLRRKGKPDEAMPHLRRALDMARSCGAHPLAKLASDEVRDDGEQMQGLTKQENRVARMAAQGLTNRQIAETLHLTRRTVELHLSGVYRKLGINGRAELVAALWS